MKFTIQVSKNVTFTTTALERLPKEREQQFRLMMFLKAKEMNVNGVKLRLS